MSTETNQDGVNANTEENGTEGEQTAEEIKLAKAEYEELLATKATVGSLKRELKDLKKSKEEPTKETPKNDSLQNELLVNLILKTEGVTESDEVELARKIQKETGKEWTELLGSKYFKSELEDLRAQKANEKAVAGVRGEAGKGEAKNTPEYWIAKGVPPTTQDVPDRKTRATIARAMISNTKSGKTFYSD